MVSLLEQELTCLDLMVEAGQLDISVDVAIDNLEKILSDDDYTQEEKDKAKKLLGMAFRLKGDVLRSQGKNVEALKALLTEFEDSYLTKEDKEHLKKHHH